MAAGPTVFDGRLAANPALGRPLELFARVQLLPGQAHPQGHRRGRGQLTPFTRQEPGSNDPQPPRVVAGTCGWPG